jgi:uncharacterized protein YjiS (DUF1127 family)
MREFMFHEAQSRLAYGRLTWIKRLVSNWRMRKTLLQLRGLSNYQLRDIGLRRDELERLISLPLNSDHAWNKDCHTYLTTTVASKMNLFAAPPNLGRAGLFVQKASPSGHFPQHIGGEGNTDALCL